MPLHKMQNPQINLKPQKPQNNEAGEIILPETETNDENKKKQGHRQEFAERIKKIERHEEQITKEEKEEKPAQNSEVENRHPREDQGEIHASKDAVAPKVNPAKKPALVRLIGATKNYLITRLRRRHSVGGVNKAEMIMDLRHPSPKPKENAQDKVLPAAQNQQPVKGKEKERKKYQTYKFPDNFLWGTGTSAYQIEGGIVHDWVAGGEMNVVDIYNDWSVWEISRERKARLLKKGKNLYDYICAGACDSYNRYREDLDLAAKLDNNAIRFGLEWSRIEIKKDTWSTEAINHYRDMMKEAHSRGLKTIVTLWHYTIPLWLAAEGGWANKKTIERFARFTELAVNEFGSYVDYWVTLNEPMIHVVDGYLIGRNPPNRKNIIKAIRAFNNLVEAHKKAYRIIHKHFPQARVSVAKMINYFEPARKWCPVEFLIAKTARYFWNLRFLKKIDKHFDYIGLNYYFHDRIVWYPPFKKNKNKKVSDIGWEIYPEGIYHVLKYLQQFNKPILITENGLADSEDKYRPDFIKKHLYWVHRAIEEGVNVRGYFHWSLLDNFEWAKGWDPKFGLYAVDRKTFKRTPRPSAKVYADICKNNRILIDDRI